MVVRKVQRRKSPKLLKKKSFAFFGDDGCSCLGSALPGERKTAKKIHCSGRQG
jgi:hypothetical protein